MTFTLEEKIEKVVEQYDPDLVLDILNITTRELIEAFPEEFLNNYDCFEVIFEELYTDEEENIDAR